MFCDFLFTKISNHRIRNHKVFKGIAERGRGSMGWFYGLKVHLVINDRGEILACQITPGNVDDANLYLFCANAYLAS